MRCWGTGKGGQSGTCQSRSITQGIWLLPLLGVARLTATSSPMPLLAPVTTATRVLTSVGCDMSEPRYGVLMLALLLRKQRTDLCELPRRAKQDMPSTLTKLAFHHRL